MTGQNSSHVLCREFRVMDEDQLVDLATLATSMTLQPWHAAAEIAGIAARVSESCIATRIRQLSRIITRVYDDAMRPLGITASQFTLLTQLAQQDGITAVEIGFVLDIEKSTLSRNLKRLLALGLIIMDPPAGRRGRGLHLTPKGQAVIKEAFPVWQSAQQKAVRVMGPDGRTTLDGLLQHAAKLAAA
jgi:DNA-binding MarR family transcriptional regulator